MNRQQLEDGRFARHAHKPSPRGHRPSRPPLPVANGRAQPKDRTRSKKHKKSRSAHGQQQLPHRHSLQVGKTHFLLRQLTVTCAWVRTEESVRRAPAGGVGGQHQQGGGRGSRSSAAGRRRQPVGQGPRETEALSLSSTTDPHQYLRANKISRAGGGGGWGEVWDFFDCFLLRNVWKTNIWWQKYSFLCIYCLHIDATFKGYRNADGFGVWSV